MLRYESAERESSKIVGALLARCSYLKQKRSQILLMCSVKDPEEPFLTITPSFSQQAIITINTFKKLTSFTSQK